MGSPEDSSTGPDSGPTRKDQSARDEMLSPEALDFIMRETLLHFFNTYNFLRLNYEANGLDWISLAGWPVTAFLDPTLAEEVGCLETIRINSRQAVYFIYYRRADNLRGSELRIERCRFIDENLLVESSVLNLVTGSVEINTTLIYSSNDDADRVLALNYIGDILDWLEVDLNGYLNEDKESTDSQITSVSASQDNQTPFQNDGSPTDYTSAGFQLKSHPRTPMEFRDSIMQLHRLVDDTDAVTGSSAELGDNYFSRN